MRKGQLRNQQLLHTSMHRTVFSIGQQHTSLKFEGRLSKVFHFASTSKSMHKIFLAGLDQKKSPTAQLKRLEHCLHQKENTNSRAHACTAVDKHEQQTAMVGLVPGLLVWPICRGWHAVMTTTALLDAQHCLYFAVAHQGSATPTKHGRECNLTIDSCIPTLWVTALSRSDVAGKHNIWCVCLGLHKVGVNWGKDG